MSINLDNIKKSFQKVEDLTEETTISYSANLEPGLIHPSQKNTYNENDTDEAIKELADNIDLNGLLHPVAVRKLSNDEYELMSGERRYKAITTHLKWRTIPCTIFENISDNKAEEMLHAANLETREYTPAQKLRFYDQVTSCIQRQIDAGEYRGSKQKKVADVLHITDRQVRKYKAITENLTDEEISRVESGELSINKASEIAQEKKSGTGSASPSSEISGDQELTPRQESWWERTFREVVKMRFGKLKIFTYYVEKAPVPADAIKNTLKPYGGYSGSSNPDNYAITLTNKDITISIINRELFESAPKKTPSTRKYKYSQIDEVIRDLIKTGELLSDSDYVKYYEGKLAQAKERARLNGFYNQS